MWSARSRTSIFRSGAAAVGSVLYCMGIVPFMAMGFVAMRAVGSMLMPVIVFMMLVSMAGVFVVMRTMIMIADALV